MACVGKSSRQMGYGEAQSWLYEPGPRSVLIHFAKMLIDCNIAGVCASARCMLLADLTRPDTIGSV